MGRFLGNVTDTYVIPTYVVFTCDIVVSASQGEATNVTYDYIAWSIYNGDVIKVKLDEHFQLG